MTMKNYCIILLTGLLLLSGCDKLLEVKPEYILTGKEAYATEATADSVLTGLYNSLAGAPFTGDGFLLSGLSADELKPGDASFMADYNFIYNYTLGSQESSTNSFWGGFYKTIHISNAIINGVTESATLTDAVKSRISGEAKFVRALLYYYLVNYYGDVPIVTETNYNVTRNIPRMPAKDVYAQITKDLKEAVVQLPDAYRTTERTRVNKYAAMALLARVSLFTRDWQTALDMSAAVIGKSDLYEMGELAADTTLNIFHSDSRETIFQLWTTYGVAVGSYTLSSWSSFAVADGPGSILNGYDPTDKRKYNFIAPNDYNGYKPYKYRLADADPSYKEYYVVLRLAEQYLIRAEARMELGLPGVTDDIDVVRARAGAPLLGNSFPAAGYRDALVTERRLELCFENADRWFTLKRTGRADAVMSQAKPGTWKSTAVLYPVPRIEIQNNPLLKQNDGYQ